VTLTGALAAFLPQQAAVDPVDEAVRVAVVRERAAQRADDLLEQAEDATRLTRTAAKENRAKELKSTDREIRETAVRIAAERRQRALAVRIAAETARRRAEATVNTPTLPDATTATQNTNPSALPAGTVGSEPVPGAVVGASFGATGLWARYHTGLDFRAAQGTPIRSVQAGIVLFAGNSGNWAGNHVAVLHADGVTTMSSHMSSMAVRPGDQVTAGQVIGRVGQTGRAFGAHLHFEVYPRGVRYGDLYSAINPLPWLQAQGIRTR
jgi:murein DD-endopeptidase MepM/ murein hydrolase activator NlpD